MEMPKATEARQKLGKLAGRWKGEETMHPSEWDPKGGKCGASMTSRVGIDGFVVTGDYEQSKGGVVTFRGHAVYWYDTNEKTNVLHWWDSMGMEPNVFKGAWKGDVLALTSPSPQGTMRVTYDLSRPDEMRLKMEMSMDGTSWMPLIDGAYRREG